MYISYLIPILNKFHSKSLSKVGITDALDWIVFPPNSCPPKPQNVTLFGNRVFVDVTKVRNKRRLYWTRVDLKSKACPYRRQKRMDRDSRKEIMWRQIEIGIALPQVKECPKPPGAGRSKEKFSARIFRGNMALSIVWFWISGFRNFERINSRVFLSHEVCGNLL